MYSLFFVGKVVQIFMIVFEVTTGETPVKPEAMPLLFLLTFWFSFIIVQISSTDPSTLQESG